MSARSCTLAALLGAALAALTVALPAQAAPPSAEQQLADRFAPIVRLKQHSKECGSGEPYRPASVDLVLGNPEVTLRNADSGAKQPAPTAADLYGLGDAWYLDLPGDPLSPGCSYEKQFLRWNGDRPPITYAHVATEQGKPGKLALQYWFYYTFNDFNDKHESDWEMIQLAFDADTAEQALSQTPAQVIYSQHGGGELASWDASKLQKVGDHPVVYPGSGSHANYYGPNLYLGRSASEGFGCDDTRGPSTEVRPRAIVVPTTPDSRESPFAWLAFSGRWGQKERGANNGPTGPNTKDQWLAPITWMDSTGRDSSVTVPGQSTFGPNVAGFFCGAVAKGSNALNAAVDSPWTALGLFVVLGLACLVLWRRTRWRPHDPLPVEQPRAVGQVLRAAWTLHSGHRRFVLGVGLSFLVMSAVFAGVEAVLLKLTGLGDFVSVADRQSPVTALLVLLSGGTGVLIAAVFTAAATAAFVAGLADDRTLTTRQALDVLRTRWRPLVGVTALVTVVSAVLIVTVIGIPLAIYLLVRWGLVTPACVIDGQSVRGSRSESARLVHGGWWRTLGVTALVNVTPLIVAPLIGVIVLLLFSGVAIWFVNLIGSLVFMFVYPYSGLAVALYFYDRRARCDGPVAA